MALRADVWELDGGRCVGCGEPVRRNGDIWVYHAHHVIPKNILKARGLRPKWWRGPALCILLDRRCHERQTSRMAVIPSERLPERIHYAVGILGPWAQDMLARYHPSDGAHSA